MEPELQLSFYHHLEGRIGFNSQSFLVYREGLSRALPGSLMMNRMAVLHQDSGGYWEIQSKYLPRFDGAQIHYHVINHPQIDKQSLTPEC